MHKVLIIEDENLAVKRLKNLLETIQFEHQVLANLDSVEASVKWLSDNKAPDLIFLDIHLADGLSFSIFDQITISTPIIFTTAYDQYAIKAFELNSIDYLLKPIEEEKLQQSLEKFEKLHQPSSIDLDEKLIDLVKSFRQQSGNYKRRFLVQKADSLWPVFVEDIAYFYAADKEVQLVTKDNKKFFLNYTLDKLEANLNPAHFYRANRSFIISIDAIAKVNTYFNYKLKIETAPPSENEIIVSKTKVSDFKKWLNGY